MDLNIKNNIIILINNSSSAILSSIDENNYPEMKSMFIKTVGPSYTSFRQEVLDELNFVAKKT